MSRSVKGTSRKVKGMRLSTHRQRPKTVDEMSVAELRVLAPRYGVKSGGKKKANLKAEIKAKMKEVKLSDTAYLKNIESGSITTASFPEERFNVSVIDQDVEPHREARVERLDEGTYRIEQETVLGEKETVDVQVSYTDPMLLASSKPKTFQRSAEFEADLKTEYDLINRNKRAGGMVKIPDLYREMKGKYSEEDFRRQLLRMERERIIELQTASDHKLISENERDGGFYLEGDKIFDYENRPPGGTRRGYINYVVFRYPVPERRQERKTRSEARAYLEQNDPTWENKSTAGKNNAVSYYLATGEIIDYSRRSEVAEVDQRGFRGNHAENQVIDALVSEGWDVTSRPSQGHDLVVQKRRWKKYYDVKEINETVDSGTGEEKGRVQIDKAELQRIKDFEKESTSNKASFIIKINKDDGTENWKELSLTKASRLLRGKKDPVKIPYSQIERLPSFKPMISDSMETSSKPMAITVQQVRVKRGRILPAQSFDYPSSWDKSKIEKEEDKRDEYAKANLPPFYNMIKNVKRRSSNEVFDLDDLRTKAEPKEIAAEKLRNLTKEEKQLEYGSFGGQNIQAKTNGQIFRGFYDQEGKYNQINHFFKADMLKVDSDDTGHYLAMMNELYTGHKAKTIYFGNEIGEIDYLRANKFLGKQILSSLSYQRNKAIQDALSDTLKQVPIKEELIDKREQFSPLAYRDSSGKVQDLSVSEEQLAIANTIFERPVKIRIHLVDSKQEIIFDYNEEDLDETARPILYFDSVGGKVKPLDSDTLLQYSVDRMQLEPDSVQNMLEALYQQGWINYPRADTIKAEDEPIYLLRDINEFQGTEYEKKLLKLIDSADKAYKEGKPYIENGFWVLQQGDVKLKRSGLKIVDETGYYTDEGFDVGLDRGISPSELTSFLIENDITTPATRTAILSSMKEAGVVSLDQKRKYQLDRRGIYFASAYEFFSKNNIETSIELKKKISNTKTIEEIADIVNSYDLVNRKRMKVFIRDQAEIMLEQQNDLTVLEGY